MQIGFPLSRALGVVFHNWAFCQLSALLSKMGSYCPSILYSRCLLWLFYTPRNQYLDPENFRSSLELLELCSDLSYENPIYFKGIQSVFMGRLNDKTQSLQDVYFCTSRLRIKLLLGSGNWAFLELACDFSKLQKKVKLNQSTPRECKEPLRMAPVMAQYHVFAIKIFSF